MRNLSARCSALQFLRAFPDHVPRSEAPLLLEDRCCCKLDCRSSLTLAALLAPPELPLPNSRPNRAPAPPAACAHALQTRKQRPGGNPAAERVKQGRLAPNLPYAPRATPAAGGMRLPRTAGRPAGRAAPPPAGGPAAAAAAAQPPSADSDASSPRAVIGALPLARPRSKPDSLLSRPDGHAQDIVHLLNAGWWVLAGPLRRGFYLDLGLCNPHSALAPCLDNPAVLPPCCLPVTGMGRWRAPGPAQQLMTRMRGRCRRPCHGGAARPQRQPRQTPAHSSTRRPRPPLPAAALSKAARPGTSEQRGLRCRSPSRPRSAQPTREPRFKTCLALALGRGATACLAARSHSRMRRLLGPQPCSSSSSSRRSRRQRARRHSGGSNLPPALQQRSFREASIAAAVASPAAMWSWVPAPAAPPPPPQTRWPALPALCSPATATAVPRPRRATARSRRLRMHGAGASAASGPASSRSIMRPEAAARARQAPAWPAMTWILWPSRR